MTLDEFNGDNGALKTFVVSMHGKIGGLLDYCSYNKIVVVFETLLLISPHCKSLQSRLFLITYSLEIQIPAWLSSTIGHTVVLDDNRWSPKQTKIMIPNGGNGL